jgi:hypothetical protein
VITNQVLGKGASAKVYASRRVKTDAQFACKVIASRGRPQSNAQAPISEAAKQKQQDSAMDDMERVVREFEILKGTAHVGLPCHENMKIY